MADVLAKVEQIARMAGLNFERRGELLYLGFDLGGGRSQTIAVGHLSEASDGSNVIMFLSPCQRISSGLLGGLSKNDALNLLRHNANLPLGHFCIMQIGDNETVCVRTTQILETMQVKDFDTNCRGVASLADHWEKEIGRDEF